MGNRVNTRKLRRHWRKVYNELIKICKKSTCESCELFFAGGCSAQVLEEKIKRLGVKK